MAKSDTLKDTVYYHYSPTYKYSVGLEQVKDKVLNRDYAYLRFTYLLNRKNTDVSQRNLYFESGISSIGLDNFFYGIRGDWETRRLFAGFGYRKNATKAGNFNEQYLQLGVAPYVGDYGDLHTWIMMKTKKNTITDEWDTYPVLKFFKGSALVELGYGNKSDWDLHLMYIF